MSSIGGFVSGCNDSRVMGNNCAMVTTHSGFTYFNVVVRGVRNINLVKNVFTPSRTGYNGGQPRKVSSGRVLTSPATTIIEVGKLRKMSDMQLSRYLRKSAVAYFGFGG